MWSVFEQPWTLVGAAVIVLFGVLTFRSVWSEKQKWWQWLLPIGVAGLGFGLDYAVATDLEKINRVLKAGIQAVQEEDCAAIARLLAADYEDSHHRNKQSLVSRCRARLTPPAVEKVKKLSAVIDLTAPTARVTFTLFMRFDKDSYWATSYKKVALVKVQLRLRKQFDANWLITRAEVLEVDKMSVSWSAT